MIGGVCRERKTRQIHLELYDEISTVEIFTNEMDTIKVKIITSNTDL